MKKQEIKEYLLEIKTKQYNGTWKPFNVIIHAKNKKDAYYIIKKQLGGTDVVSNIICLTEN